MHSMFGERDSGSTKIISRIQQISVLGSRLVKSSVFDRNGRQNHAKIMLIGTVETDFRDAATPSVHIFDAL